MFMRGNMSFADRREAGRQLGHALKPRVGAQPMVLALPRGGVPVAAEVAAILGAPLDILVVRKLGVPHHEEYAMGAIASGGVMILREDIVGRLGLRRRDVDAVVAREQRELARREQLYRRDKPPITVEGRTVVVVDDGIATGSTMLAAVQLLRHRHAGRIIVAVPVAATDAIEQLREEADDVVALLEPDPFVAVGLYYKDFSQTTDEEVRAILEAQDEEADCPYGEPGTADAGSGAPACLRGQARPLTGADDDYDELMDMIGDAPVVLLGEATHGTDEFYQQRAGITKRLIREKGFQAVAVEADWPDAYRVNRFVRGEGRDPGAAEALGGFQRFPAWMWRNAAVLDFVGWLKAHNDRLRSPLAKVGFYGLDLYSLHKSMDEVIRYLERIDPDEARRAKMRYACMDRYGPDPQNYGLLVSSGVSEGCRSEIARQLQSLREKEVEYLSRDGATAADELFFAQQNARLVRNAEMYYRKMFRSDVSSWNLRDEHMMEMLVEVIAHCDDRHGTAKVVVWAHNSHLGDARATDRTRRGELNLGQLVREAFPQRSVSIGFTTYEGTVTAASGWHLPAGNKKVRPALPGSHERLFHETGIPAFWLDLTTDSPAANLLDEPRLERAIGVVYAPQTERQSHYFTARLASQFDAVIHFDRTRAVEPLEKTAEWSRTEAPETFPVGL